MNILKKTENIKFLCIRLSSIGDIVLTTPVIRCLKQKFPNSTIDFVVRDKFSSLLENNPAISRIIPYSKEASLKEILSYKDELKSQNGTYDYIIDLQNNNRSKIFRFAFGSHILATPKRRLYKWCLVALKRRISPPIQVVDNYFVPLRRLNVFPDDKGTEVNISASFIKSFRNNGNKNMIAIAPGATHFSKRYPAEKFAQAISEIDKKGNYQFVIAGGTEDITTAEKIMALFGNNNIESFAGKLQLDETAALLSLCRLLITNDTGIMHIASAVQIPVLAIFGSTVPDFGFSPYHCKYKIMEKQLHCRPCTHIGRSDCPKGTFACMEKISPKEVATNALLLI